MELPYAFRCLIVVFAAVFVTSCGVAKKNDQSFLSEDQKSTPAITPTLITSANSNSNAFVEPPPPQATAN